MDLDSNHNLQSFRHMWKNACETTFTEHHATNTPCRPPSTIAPRPRTKRVLIIDPGISSLACATSVPTFAPATAQNSCSCQIRAVFVELRVFRAIVQEAILARVTRSTSYCTQRASTAWVDASPMCTTFKPITPNFCMSVTIYLAEPSTNWAQIRRIVKREKCQTQSGNTHDVRSSCKCDHLCAATTDS